MCFLAFHPMTGVWVPSRCLGHASGLFSPNPSADLMSVPMLVLAKGAAFNDGRADQRK